MRWDRFFDDLEDQLASEWEAERAALDTEAERLRLSRVSLRDRLQALAGSDRPAATFETADGSRHVATVTGVGADWVGLASAEGRARGMIVPLTSIEAVGMPHAELLHSARPAPATSSIVERMTLGFVLRDLARRRSAVVVHLMRGRSLAGTIDRAGADHLDLALHEPGTPRRADVVTGHRVVAFGAIAWLATDAAAVP
ncbi:hypothetical protein GCM10009775_17800 [Microbacterium aoyamense]|uniref:Fis family transcriptional regulator n=1 Tax=Microbacterium aoyamense TaxID=344166 RepID=A0ABN2PP73_9MICO|nr:hypothetical protein [Microbacterium aoyamense]